MSLLNPFIPGQVVAQVGVTAVNEKLRVYSIRTAINRLRTGDYGYCVKMRRLPKDV